LSDKYYNAANQEASGARNYSLPTTGSGEPR